VDEKQGNAVGQSCRVPVKVLSLRSGVLFFKWTSPQYEHESQTTRHVSKTNFVIVSKLHLNFEIKAKFTLFTSFLLPILIVTDFLTQLLSILHTSGEACSNCNTLKVTKIEK